jgi:hypothetical protein
MRVSDLSAGKPEMNTMFAAEMFLKSYLAILKLLKERILYRRTPPSDRISLIICSVCRKLTFLSLL